MVRVRIFFVAKIVCFLITAKGRIASSAKSMFFFVTVHLTMKSLFYLLRKKNKFLIYSEIFCLASSVSPIDSGISQSIQQSSKLTMTKVLEKNGRTEMTVSTEKEQGKRNSTDLWEKMGFLARKFVTSLYRKHICLKRPFFT